LVSESGFLISPIALNDSPSASQSLLQHQIISETREISSSSKSKNDQMLITNFDKNQVALPFEKLQVSEEA